MRKACESQASFLEVAAVFYEFTGTITYHFLTNQKVRSIQVALQQPSNLRSNLPFLY